MFPQKSVRRSAWTALAVVPVSVWILAAPAMRVEAEGAGTSVTLAELWLAPVSAPAAKSSFVLAIDQLVAGRPSLALPYLTKATSDPVLGGYALLYQGRAQLALSRPNEAATAALALLAKSTSGYLREAAFLLAADTYEAYSDWPSTIKVLEGLAAEKPASPERVYLRLGRAALSAHDKLRAADALTRVYYDYPLSPEADSAALALAQLAPRGILPAPTADTLARDLTRAQVFYAAKRYTDARKGFAAARDVSTGVDRELVDMRIAECDLALKHPAPALEELKIIQAKGTSRQTELDYNILGALRDAGRGDEYLSGVRAFLDAAGTDPFAEEALNDLATYQTKQNNDAAAAQAYAELFQKFPSGVRADRAAWKVGWWAYKNGSYANAAEIFDAAAASLRHADYRPSWLFWAARSRLRLGDTDTAWRGFRQVVADYRNSYYGRRAAALLTQDPNPPVMLASVTTDPEPKPLIPATPAPPDAPVIRALLAAGMYDDAVAELKYLQRTSGTSPVIEASIAYALNRRGDLRPAITTMRRAYPQFLADGGEGLPRDLLTVIFPVQYWEMIRKYSALHQLDPFVVAALINQESTFDPTSKSGADAYGLMQILPSTGREYARNIGIAPFRTSRLLDPETNIRIGTAFFADLLKNCGDVAVALAAYNAGESRATRWLSERPGIDRDQFIDDIPFPETQNYVKRILGSADDYRALYGKP